MQSYLRRRKGMNKLNKLIEKYMKLSKQYETITLAEVIKDLCNLRKIKRSNRNSKQSLKTNKGEKG